MIGKLFRAARKLRGRSADEIYVRGGQAVAALLERAHLGDASATYDPARSLRLVPNGDARPDALLAAWRARAPLLPAARDRDATLDALRTWCRGDEADAVRRAERVLAGQFDLLGYEGLDFGTPIDWHRDPVHGVRAPMAHWSRIRFLDPTVVGDHKVTWEINRHQYFVTLGQAYAYTGDARYAEAFAAHVAAWLDANPPKAGINWASSLEVAYRAISWTWALWLFRDAEALGASLYARMLTALDLHGRHLARHLSTYFSPNTHLTGEALGLYYIGSAFPELAGARAWRETGRRVLADQVSKQVRPDGVYFEQASQYHRYTVEIFLHFLLIGSWSGDAVAERAREPLVRLFTFLRYIARPDGTIPLFGDDDGGRLVQLDGRPARDVRALLSTGATALGDDRLRLSTWRADLDGHLAAALWLLGPSAAPRDDAKDAAPTPPSRLFADSGFAVLRDGWTPDGDWALLDCGVHGVMNCGHAHADACALEIAARGRPLFVDSGTYSYPYLAERNAFRGGDAHNAVTVDDASSSQPGAGPFVWDSIAEARVTSWTSDARHDAVTATHDGFARLDPSIAYVRSVLFVKRDEAGRGGYWVVRDRLASEREHAVTVHWHLAPGLAATPTAEGMRIDDAAGEPVAALVAFDDDGIWQRRDGWVSHAYGSRQAATVIARRVTARDADVVSFVLPENGGALPIVREVPAAHGRAWEVEFAWGTDRVTLADEVWSVDHQNRGS